MINIIIETSDYFLSQLEEKQRIIISRRFGLETGKRETLESIGQEFGITRERVRQIEKKALFFIKERVQKNSPIQKVYKEIKNYLISEGGLKKEEAIPEELDLKEVCQHLLFFMHLDDGFYRYRESDIYYSFWTISPSKVSELERILEISIKEMEKINQPLSEEEFFGFFRTEISRNLKKNISKKIYKNYFDISKALEKGPDGKIGLTHWPEIKPRGVRDKAYIVLKNQGRPFHFREIARLIEEMSPEKRVHIQTLHNELIKDDRFVLVGRGYYALREWGYQQGVLRDIIISILKTSRKPLSREEIVKEVKKQRIVKPATILTVLYDKKTFQRTSDNRYYLKV